MGKLQVLPAQVANMIAAGEVVQRPASVVKELVENAVDAGADKINVVVTDSGKTLIQVIDNGCGMSPADAVLCFERHATSKIASPEDLERILTYGFRGEALASIAAVADVTLKTRRAQDETATQVTVGEFGQVKSATVAAPVGSNFAIRNLFYNTPARRKFLKSDSVEFKHIVEEFTRVAIPHPEIAFTLTHNGRDVFVLAKAKSLKFRILDLMGSNVVGDIVDITAETSVVRVSGFVGKPDTARKTLGNQYFFVGGRYFRSAYLHKAVMKAYEEMIPDGATPSYFIFLDIDPESMDVNIHPTKTEIKFEDDNVIFQVLYACVKETLGRNSFGASIDFDTEGTVELPQLGRSFEEYRAGGLQAPATQLDPTYDPFNFGSMSEGHAPAPAAPSMPANFDFAGPKQSCAPLFPEQRISAKAMVVQGRFILTPASSGLMMVHVRRARERILYEKALKALSAGGQHVSQTALFPVQVQVGVRERLLFDDNAATLAQLGFDIAPMGTDSIVVGGVPEGYSCEPGKVQQMVSDLVLVLSDPGSSLPDIMRQSMAEKFATLGATGADTLTDPVEAQRIVDALFACDNAEVTPGGRRIVTIVSIDELEKRF